jgi:hypothetical protein
MKAVEHCPGSPGACDRVIDQSREQGGSRTVDHLFPRPPAALAAELSDQTASDPYRVRTVQNLTPVENPYVRTPGN